MSAAISISNSESVFFFSFSNRDTNGVVDTPFSAAVASRKGKTLASASTEVTLEPNFCAHQMPEMPQPQPTSMTEPVCSGGFLCR